MSAEPIPLPVPEPDPRSRGATPPLGRGDVDLARVYVWEIPVRVTHWLIALSILVLSVTGIYIGHPFLIVKGQAVQRFVMGGVRVTHSYTAIVFTLSVLARIGWMFAGNRYARWNNFIPVERRRRAGLWSTLKFYTFLLPKAPPCLSHNPLAGASYVAVFGLYLVAIVTGLGLYGGHTALHSPLRAFAFLAPLLGGAQTLRWVHHVVMWLFLGFAVHHVYCALLMSHVDKNGTMESIFSGYKFAPRAELADDGYRFGENPRPLRPSVPSDQPRPSPPSGRRA